MTKKEKPKMDGAVASRRNFLRVLGAGTAAAAVPMTVTSAQADSENANERTKARYKETDHIKRFYDTARYPK